MNWLNTTFIKGQHMLQKDTFQAWELIMEEYQKNKMLLEERKTKKSEPKF